MLKVMAKHVEGYGYTCWLSLWIKHGGHTLLAKKVVPPPKILKFSFFMEIAKYLQEKIVTRVKTYKTKLVNGKNNNIETEPTVVYMVIYL